MTRVMAANLGPGLTPIDPATDERCQPWAYITLGGDLYEVITWEPLAAYLRVTNCRTECEHKLTRYELRKAQLVRPAPTVEPDQLAV